MKNAAERIAKNKLAVNASPRIRVATGALAHIFLINAVDLAITTFPFSFG